MASLSGIRSAVADALASISGLNVYQRAPGSPNVPAAVVIPGEPAVAYDSSMARQSDTYEIVVRLIVSAADDDASQDALDAYIAGSGDRSVKAAIEADTTLGGEVFYVRVTQVRAYGDFEHAGVTYLGCEFVVAAEADGA